MNNPSNPFLNNAYYNLKSRLYPVIMAELEGSLNPDSPEDMAMFDAVFTELLSNERVRLSTAERKRLFDELVADVANAGRR
jgi:hypothetical protein